eukprot:TRINITY_DN28996_c0_g1_i2.p1 TRINITY_DN28996_c0_g1~~TRINITY_DN28996_c0_g1_i2.p1  ORF type:complete len:180 (-),score=46.95 TRINITY_DN28996_c0_g1_i2:67-579(-)
MVWNNYGNSNNLLSALLSSMGKGYGGKGKGKGKGTLTALVLYLFPQNMDATPFGYYAVVLAISLVGAAASQCMFVAQMAFFAKVSDPALGGTYMTLLNTLANLGGMWPSTATMFLVDLTTCQQSSCLVRRDGFYFVAALATVVGLAWYLLLGGFAQRLQLAKPDAWRVRG